MADTSPRLRDVLARLEGAEREFAALRATVAAQGVARSRRHWRRRLAVLAVAVLVALVPLGLLAGTPFNDLNTSSVHNPNIDAIYNAGITNGCVPDVSYCPNDNVTREQMASFLARTAGLGNNKPVTRAARLSISPPTTTSPSYAANDLTRIAFNNAPSTDPPIVPVPKGSHVTIVSVSLNVPVQAYVRVSFTAQATAASTTGCPCTLRAYLQQDAQPDIAVKKINIATVVTDLVAGFDRRDLTGSTVFLAAPGDHTYKLLVEQFDGTSSDLGIVYPNLQAELFPFGNGGAGATDIPSAPSPSGTSGD